MKNLYIIFLAFIFVYCPIIFSNEDTFVVGTSSGYAPFVSLNKKGTYEGFDIDFAHALAKKMNKKLILKDLGSMNSLMVALNQKKIDVIIWAISITQDRMKNLTLIHYQGKKETKYPIIFWKKIPEIFSENIESLCKTPKDFVCVEAGSAQEDILKSYSKLNIRYIEKITDGIMEIKYGKSIATICDTSLLPNLCKQNPELIVQYLDLPPSQIINGFGLAIKKTNKKLSDQVSKAVDELKKDKTISILEKKWNLVGK